ncbi:MAG: hypothetical protein ACO3B4_00830 [Burkholderiaceae bacterium]
MTHHDKRVRADEKCGRAYDHATGLDLSRDLGRAGDPNAPRFAG